METYLKIFLRLFCYSTALFTLHFTHILIKMLFTITTCCFLNFYKDSTSNYPVLMVFYTFFKLYIAVGFQRTFKIFENKLFTSLA